MKLRELAKEISGNRKYFADPLLLFGLLWAALTIFSLVQHVFDFDFGRYLSIFMLEFRKLSALVAAFFTFPFHIQLPPIGRDALTLWVLLSGITARTQQIKLTRNLDNLANPANDLGFHYTEDDETLISLRRAAAIKKWVVVPLNLVFWPLNLFCEVLGIYSSPQIFNLRGIWWYFGEGISPNLLSSFSRTSRALFIVQWLYIAVMLLIFFAMNALDVYIDRPGLI